MVEVEEAIIVKYDKFHLNSNVGEIINQHVTTQGM